MKVLSSLMLLLFFGFHLSAQVPAFEISGKIKGLSNTEVYLAHYFGSNQQVIKDTALVDDSGSFVFQGSEPLDEGLYLVSYNKNKYFDLVIGNSRFSFETDTVDIVGKMVIHQSPENDAFYGFQREMATAYSSLTDKQNPDFVRNQMALVQKIWVKKHANLFVSKLIQASFEPEIPPFNRPVKTSKDSSALYTYQFAYYKSHYFDYIDLNDERFLRTPFLQKKIDKYFEDLVVQESDSISKDADRLLAGIKNQTMRKYVVYKIASTYENHNVVGTDGAFVHLAEKYYIGEPALWDTTTVRKMKERMAIIKPLLIGKRVPEMFLTDPSGKLLTISSVVANYTILFIYDPDCSHCKEETPKLRDLAPYLKTKNIAILAVSLVRDKALWKKFIEEFNIQHWKNGIDIHINAKTGKEEYYTDFQKTFDAYSTPVVYILDKTKNIIGKRIPVDKIQEFLQFYESKRK